MEVLLNFVAFCLLINKGYGINSYLSSINTEGRPILRSELNVFDASKSPEVAENVPSWLGDLRARIERLVSRHGYEYAKPYIKNAVDATEKKQSVLLDVQVFRNGESTIKYEYKNIMRMRADSAEHGQGTLRTATETDWETNFKSYVRYLIGLYGIDQDKLDPHIAPVVKSLEAKYAIDIITVDVDDNGDLNVHFKTLPRPKASKNTPGLWNQETGSREQNRIYKDNYRQGKGVTHIYER